MAFEDTPSPMQQPQTGLDAYMSDYGNKLQAMLADQPQPDDGSGVPQGQHLGPDMYQANPAPFQPPAGPQGGMAAADAPSAPNAPGAGAAAPGAAPGAPQGGDQKGLTLRDVWAKQTAPQRKEYLDKLQKHLDATNQTINSAYDTMMKQLGGRPDTDLSRSEKGMLLMEFGMHMMANSRGQQANGNGGLGPNVGANIGASGLATMQSFKELRAQKIAQQQKYDQMQSQLSQAHGRDVVNLASRSALEEGRDLRAAGAQDASIARVDAQQQGAGLRQDERIQAGKEKTAVTEAGKNKRAAMGANNVTHTIVGDDGTSYGLTKTGQMIPLKDARGNAVKAAPGGVGGAKQTAAQSNYNLYVSTFGKDTNGKPLEGADLQKVQQNALEYAANPRAHALSEAQITQMAEKSADSQIRANPMAWAGMTPDEIAAKQAQIANTIAQRIRRGGTAGPNATGKAATQPPTGTSKGPNAQQLALLSADPKKNSAFFLKKFGYLPKEYQQYAQPIGGLSQ